jgi:hypothetical protein
MNNNKVDYKSSDLPSNKKFGFFFGAVFFLIGLYFFYKNEQTITVVLISLSLVFITVSLLKEDLLLPLNKLWMRFGIILGKIISPLVLAILFFVLFTPIAIGMRIFQRDELRLKLVNTKSFWKLRDQNMLAKDSFNQQF